MPGPEEERRREPSDETVWPVIDDDEPPPEPAPGERTVRVAGLGEWTRRIPVPPPADRPLPGRPDLRQAAAPWPPPEPPRAAPTRIGPEPPPGPEPRPAPRRGGRKIALLVVAALVVVAGAGAGTVALVPGLAAKLGLAGGEPEVVIQPPPPPVQFAPALRPPGQGEPPTGPGLDAALAGPVAVPGLGTLTGAVVDATTGKTLWDHGGATPLVPASTGKLLVAAAALLTLNHTDQLSTKVVAGKDPGSVVVVGGGDPTLSSLRAGTESVYPGAAHLSDLVAQVKASGTQVSTVYVDITRYAGKGIEPSWDPGDVAGGHIAPIVPAMLDGGRADATAAVSRRTDNPARALAEEFARRIGGAAVPPEASTTAPEGAKVLGEVRSAPVVELVDTLLQRSDNVLAETMAREVAKAAGEEPSFAGGSKATAKVLQENGFDTTGLNLADASGLSGQDRVPAGLLASILSVAASPDGKDPRTAKLRPLLGGLPVAGGSGTLENRYNTPGASAGRGWVRAKTGTLQTPPVNSLAGLVLDVDGRLLVFAFVSNGSATSVGRPALDAIASTLAKCGCR